MPLNPRWIAPYGETFGETVDKGLGPNKAFPFFYAFVNRRDSTWTPNDTFANNINGIGPTVPALGNVQHVIQLDPDYNFRMISIKYTAYYVREHIALNDEYQWYDNEAGWRLDYGDYQLAHGTPLVHFIDVSVSCLGDARYLYGGLNLNRRATQAGTTVPLPIDLLQGYDYGYGQVRTAYMIPKNGQILIDLTNTHTTKDIIVGGLVYGYKVRL